jgi:hypothetical protein
MTALDWSTNFNSSTIFSTLITPALDLERFNSSTSSALITHALDLERQLVQLRAICSIGLIDPIDFIGLENATNATHKYFQHGREKGGCPGSWHALGGQVHRFECLGKQASDAVY